jgi:hypothetical protein
VGDLWLIVYSEKKKERGKKIDVILFIVSSIQKHVYEIFILCYFIYLVLQINLYFSINSY